MSKTENFARVRNLKTEISPTKPLNSNFENFDAENDYPNSQKCIKTCSKQCFSFEIVKLLNFGKIQNFARVGDLKIGSFPAKPLNRCQIQILMPKKIENP